MAIQWTDPEIKSGIRLIFTRLGYQEVKTEQLEAIRGFIKDKDVFVSLLEAASPCVMGLPLVFDYLRKSDLKTKSIVVVEGADVGPSALVLCQGNRLCVCH